MHRCSPSLAFVCFLAAGCANVNDAPPAPTPEVSEEHERVDPLPSGRIDGKVVWSGEVPHVPPLPVRAYLDYANAFRLRHDQPNPNAPKVDSQTLGIGKAVVMLREVSSSGVRPWHHPPVRVEMQRHGIVIMQGDNAGSIGLVRRGAEIECINRDAAYHMLRGRGGAFFTLPLVASDQPTRRRLDQTGQVELSNAAGPYWQRAYLFVFDHPYATLTDAQGRFSIDEVPAGVYRLALWLPNWHVASHERDPETAAIRRLQFAKALEMEQEVSVTAGSTAQVDFVVTQDQFARSGQEK